MRISFSWRSDLILAVLLLMGIPRVDAAEPIRAAYLRSRLEEVMGPLPTRASAPAPRFQIESREDLEGFQRLKIQYESDQGALVPAYLLIPKAALTTNTSRRFPAVLALHQTHPAGAKVVVGLGNSPDDEYGVELARRGFVVLAPPYPWLAGYEPELATAGYASGTMKAITDNLRGLDLLTSLPYVRTNRGFGCIGHSLGGHNGLFTAAFDDRIRVVVTSCGFDSFRDYYDGDPKVWQPERGWCQTRYMPRLSAYQGKLDQLPFDFPEVLELIAPRSVYVNAPLGDSNFRWRSVDRVVAEVRARVTPLGVTNWIEVDHPEGPHRFPPEQRQRAYALLEAVLGAPSP